MPRAALEVDTVRYVVWDGVGASYPQWFISRVMDDILVDEYRISSYVRPGKEDVVLYETTSVFIMNSYGEVEVIDIFDFSKYYIFLEGGRAILAGGTVEYFVFTSRGPVPVWFEEYVKIGIMWNHHGSLYFYDHRGEICMDPECIILYNGEDVWYMTTEEFKSFYVREEPTFFGHPSSIFKKEKR